ncbi:MAG: hypothetical protein RLZZ175_755 [Bacteroidota bacterium]|jgi:hypothetical protein
MYCGKLKKLLLSIVNILAIIHFVNAQNKMYISGTVKSISTNESLPFTHIIVSDTSQEYLTDVNGNFTIPISKADVKSITFKQPLFRNLTININTDSLIKLGQSIEIQLTNNEIFSRLASTDSLTKNLVNNTVKNLVNVNPYINKSYQSTIYQKLVVTTVRDASIQAILSFIQRYITGKPKKEIGERHIFLMETISEKNHLDQNNQKEIITATKFSGVDDPSLLSLGSQIEQFTLYDNYIKIASSEYINPIHINTLHRYHFQLIDTVNIDKENKIFVCKYSQQIHKNFNGVGGYIYIKYPEMAVCNFVAWPTFGGSLSKKVIQSYINHKDKWFHNNTFTQMNIGSIGVQNIEMIVTSHKYENITSDTSLFPKKYFNEYIIEHFNNIDIKDPDYWNKNRAEFFSQKDENTYEFYNEVSTKIHLDKLINLGGKLYSGQIPLKKVSIDLNKIINFNKYEKFRTGFGLHTNEKMFKHFNIGAYFGYGTSDKKLKAGAEFQVILNRKKEKYINYIFFNDLSNPGESDFVYNNYIYNDERLRKYQILFKDKTVYHELNYTFRPLIYTHIKLFGKQISKTPTYNYTYLKKSDNTNAYQFTEVGLSLRFAFREMYARNENIKFAQDSKFPILHASFTKGVDFQNFGNYNYNKLEFCIDQTIRFLNFGKSTIRLQGGICNGNLPYMQTFNQTGSNNNKVDVIIHNSFITMGYNEFFANEYTSLFLCHNFGKFYAKDRTFNPIIEYMFNAGYGKVYHVSLHQNSNFKSMEKGYFETGINMNNIINLKLSGINLGVGVGFFTRLGPYSYIETSKNFLSKLTTNFYF